MKKQRKYLHRLIPISINKLVNHDGSFEYGFDGHTLTLWPENRGKRYFLCLFIDNIRQPMEWMLSSQPHVGTLRNNRIPSHLDEKWYVVGSDGKRYVNLYIDPTTNHIGTRREHFPPAGTWTAYPKRKEDKSLHEQARAQYEELFGEKDEFMAEYRKLEKRSRFGQMFRPLRIKK